MAVPWANLLARTPTAADIIPAWQPGAFSSGLRAGTAFREQRQGEKVRQEATAKADATKRAFEDTMAVLNANKDVPLPQAIEAGLRANPGAIPEVLVRTINDLMPQPTPHQQETLAETKRYHDAMTSRYDDDREERKRQFDIEQKTKESKSLGDTLTMIEDTWKDVKAKKWVKDAKTKAQEDKIGLREAMAATLPDDLDPATMKKVTDAVGPVLETRSGSEARGMTVSERLRVEEELHGNQDGKRGLYDALATAKKALRTEEAVRLDKRIKQLEKLLEGTPATSKPASGGTAAPAATPAQGKSFQDSFLESFQQWQQSRK